eukprot:scaffold23202_cov118-Isochrysis_galbana.AAC.2
MCERTPRRIEPGSTGFRQRRHVERAPSVPCATTKRVTGAAAAATAAPGFGSGPPQVRAASAARASHSAARACQSVFSTPCRQRAASFEVMPSSRRTCTWGPAGFGGEGRDCVKLVEPTPCRRSRAGL